NFAQHELVIKNGDSSKRIIKLEHEHQQTILKYYKEDIPKPVRPYEYSKHPLFVAFDFERETFRWNYEANAPKRLGIKAIQKMMKQEIARAGLRIGVSGQSMRNTCILQKMNEGKETEELQEYFGLRNPLSLWRYEKYIENKKNPSV
ncbi:TPA: site-specific integrase, partial [Escherichia coli]|nr:site-specific integrase [Escherichia coli]